MEDSLKPTLQEVLDSYKVFKASEQYYLLLLNTDICESEVNEVLIPPVPFIAEPIITPYIRKKPSSTYFITTHVNTAAKEKTDLDYVPFDESTGCVHYSTDLDVYKTNPFNQENFSGEFILNTQFVQYLVLKLIKKFPIAHDWTEASGILSEVLGKNGRLMMSTFKKTLKLYVELEEPELEEQEFRDNFCQICWKYCCITHFYDDAVENNSEKSGETEGEKKDYLENAMSILDPGHWKSIWWSREKNVLKTARWFENYHCQNPNFCFRNSAFADVKISKIQKQIIKTALKLGLQNPCAISLFLDLTCKHTAPKLQKYISKLNPPEKPQKLPKKIFYTSNFDYNKVLTNVIETHCRCKNECSIQNQCPCLYGEVVNGVLISRRCCEKYCMCSVSCQVRFLGCNCQYGRCDSKTCICYMNQRECDPELCIFCNSFQSLTQKPVGLLKKRLSKFLLCRNIRAQIRQYKHVALGESSIKGAGFGLFVLEPCEPNELITEYTGEIIRESESERRAALYDYRHHSYIFSLTPDTRWSIDSTYYGSKMRYVNHKSHNEHNTFAIVWNVNGKLKILLFAAEKISPMQELFFDYGYDSKEIKYEWFQQYEKKFKNKKSK